MRVIAAVAKDCSVVTFIETKTIVYRVQYGDYALHVYPDKTYFVKVGDKEKDTIEKGIEWIRETPLNRAVFDKLLNEQKLYQAFKVLLVQIKDLVKDEG